jgi:predicted anti-sigma-YlaC factor YlaD
LAMNHLTDDEIQACLDGTADAVPARIAQHLKKCADCRKILEEYRNLREAFPGEERFAASMNAATRALSRVQVRKKARALWEVPDALAAAIGIMIGLVVAAWVYSSLNGHSPGLRQILDFFSQYHSLASALLQATRSFIDSVRSEISFLLMAGFVVYVILSLDYLFLSCPVREKPSR